MGKKIQQSSVEIASSSATSKQNARMIERDLTAFYAVKTRTILLSAQKNFVLSVTKGGTRRLNAIRKILTCATSVGWLVTRRLDVLKSGTYKRTAVGNKVASIQNSNFSCVAWSVENRGI